MHRDDRDAHLHRIRRAVGDLEVRGDAEASALDRAGERAEPTATVGIPVLTLTTTTFNALPTTSAGSIANFLDGER